MTTPTFFRQSNENTIASYDWIDLASGTGYVDYYCGHFANAYVLTTSKTIGSTTMSHNSGATGTVMDLTFQITLNVPRTVGGIAYINIPVAAVTGSNSTARAVVTIYKNSDSIGASTGNKTLGTIAKGDNILSQVVSITETVFGAGDILKVKITLTWVENTSAACYVFHDPLGREAQDTSGTSLNMTTKMIASIPFRIQQ